jgi:BASS family bile acid:Na+ symporter
MLVLAATVWTTVVIPVLIAMACFAVGIDIRAPELFLALMLQAMASPMMAAPALATLMGLDGSIVLVILITGTVLVPFTAPLLAMTFVGPALSIPPLILAAKLFAILIGAALVGFGIRRFVGLPAIERQSERINGLNVIVLFVFVAAVMESIGARILVDTTTTAALTALAFGVFFVLLSLTVLVFMPAGRDLALALGYMASQRNMGLMLAATGGSLPDLTWLYFALSQFPIYLSPYLIQAMTKRMLRRTPLACTAGQKQNRGTGHGS